MTTLWTYVYVLKSEQDHSTYIGYTSDLNKRFVEHNAGQTKSIKHKLPMKMIYCEAYLSKKLAIKREIQLKKNSVTKKELYSRIFE